MIEMKEVWKAYPNGSMAVNGINIHIDKGEFVYIVGPSGAGKSTFIKLMYREVKPTKGNILIEGIDITKLKDRHVPKIRRKIGVAFQDDKLLSKLTVYENVALGQAVSQGQTIGSMGSTGESTGSHLHFELYKGPWAPPPHPGTLNPMSYIN